ncbi:MAG: hypothetical protein KGZ45_03425 [Clostridium sp.]|nr:hypothetical protein [Clostridium sp.]
MNANTSLSNIAVHNTNRKVVISVKAFRELAAAGIILISLVPETSNRFLFVTFFSLWITLAYVSNVRGFIKAFIYPNIKSYSVYAWLLLYMIFYLTGYMQGVEIDRIFNYLRLGFTLLLINYYIESENWSAIKKLTVFSLGCMAFSCITTLRALALDPLAARVLATGREELIQGLEGLMIGSYGLVYGLVFVTVALVGLLKAKLLTGWKAGFLIIAVLFAYTIFSAAFMIALLLFLFGLTLMFLNIKRTKSMLLTIVIFIALVLLMSPFLYDTFNYLGDLTEHNALSMRFYELAHMVRYGTAEGTVTSEARVQLYLLSLSTFFENPILGVGGFYGFGTSIFGIGGHSAFLDELAKYGILGTGFLFVALFSNAFYVYKKLRSNKQKAIYYSAMIPFFVLGLINTLLFIPIFFAAYFVVPGLIFSYYKPDPMGMV